MNKRQRKKYKKKMNMFAEHCVSSYKELKKLNRAYYEYDVYMRRILNSTKERYYYCSSCEQFFKTEELVNSNCCNNCGSTVYDLREWIH